MDSPSASCTCHCPTVPHLLLHNRSAAHSHHVHILHFPCTPLPPLQSLHVSGTWRQTTNHRSIYAPRRWRRRWASEGNWNPLSTFKNKARLVTAWPSRIVYIYREIYIFIYAWAGTLCQSKTASISTRKIIQVYTHTLTQTQRERS